MNMTHYVFQGLRIDYSFLKECVPDFVEKLEERDRKKHKVDVVIDLADGRYVYMGRIVARTEEWGFPVEIDLIDVTSGDYAEVASEITGLLVEIGAPWFEMQVFKNISLWAFTHRQ